MSKSKMLPPLSPEERRKLYEENIRNREQQAKDREEAERETERTEYIIRAIEAIRTDKLPEFLWEMEQRLRNQSHGEPQIKSE